METIVVYNKFPTHVPVTRNKKAPNKYQKISGQSLYSGSMNHYQREIAVEWLHNYLLIEKSQTYWDGLKHVLSTTEYPLKIHLYFHAPLNYGTVRRLKGNVVWHPAEPDYIPNWDIDNQWIWGKLFCDVLQIAGAIPNDNVKFINRSTIEFVDTLDLEDRKLVFKIYT